VASWSMVKGERVEASKQDLGGNEIGRLPWSDDRGTKRRISKDKRKDWARVQVGQVGGGV
jgi:hypothetical protein